MKPSKMKSELRKQEENVLKKKKKAEAKKGKKSVQLEEEDEEEEVPDKKMKIINPKIIRVKVSCSFNSLEYSVIL